MIKKIVLLGSGKLAWNLGSALNNNGLELVSVYSRSLENARQLANALSSTGTDQIEEIPTDADLYIIAVSDKAIPSIGTALGSAINKDSILVHCSGATSINVFQTSPHHFGVFYPFQTFTKSHLLDFSSIPIGVDSPHESTKQALIQLAKLLSNQVYILNDQQRKQLHIAGVFSNNFVNHLNHIAFELLNEKGIPKAILHNIIQETARKAIETKPFTSQTGPAVRGDIATIEDHQKLLADKDVYLKIYQLMTESIIKDHR